MNNLSLVYNKDAYVITSSYFITPGKNQNEFIHILYSDNTLIKLEYRKILKFL